VNFLAHLWLADQTKTSLAGAILGDVVRGADLTAYPDEIARGIRLHRKIDAATDRHPRIVSERERYASGQRRYAGIVLDLACDFLLSGQWPTHSTESLPDFCARAAEAVAGATPWFELAGARGTQAPQFTELLLSYGSEAGIERALRRVASRMRESDGLLIAGGQWRASAARLGKDLPELLGDLKRLGS